MNREHDQADTKGRHGADELHPSDLMKWGFFELEAGRRIGAERRSAIAANQTQRSRVMRKISYRELPRICVPGIFIDRAVQAALRPIVLAGPELDKRLQPHVARLCDISTPSRSQRWLRSALLWLLEDRESEPEETEVSVPARTSWPDADFLQMDLPPETQTPLWPDFGTDQTATVRGHHFEGPKASAHALPKSNTRGVR